MKKVVVALALCLSLSIGGTNVYAAPSVETYGVQRAEECGNCGKLGTFRLVSTTYGTWSDVGTQKCSKYANKVDIIQKRQVSKKYKCTSCKYVFIRPTGTERRVYCNHKSAE